MNTTGARASENPRERLRSYEDLLTWSVRAELLDPSEAARLRAAARGRSAKAGKALRRCREVREVLYRILRAVAERTAVPADDLARLDPWLRSERTRQLFAATPGGFELRHRVEADELDGMLWPILSSAVDLLTSARLGLLKRCGECDWLFLDETKNRSRTWCKKVCGDRVRARRHYDRIRARPSVNDS